MRCDSDVSSVVEFPKQIPAQETAHIEEVTNDSELGADNARRR